MERKIVRKWFWVWDFEKEEQWLNTMVQSGWVLDRVGLCRYEFLPCEPGEYTLRLEMRDYDESYLALMADSGAEYVGRMAKWIYFRKKAELGRFDIFSDLDSRIGHLRGICRMLGGLGGANIALGLYLVQTGHSEFGWINLLASTVLLYALGRIQGKIEALGKERLLME